MKPAGHIEYPVEQIRQWIGEGKTQAWIADELRKTVDKRVTAKLIYKVCKKHEIQCQRTGPRSGAGHYHSWKGGRIVDKGGYILVYCPGHPHARKKGRSGKGMYVLEHRLVMEQHLSRYLKPRETIHHKNKDSSDNRIENLVLYPSNGEHLKEELKGKVPNWSDDGKRRIGIKVDQSDETHA